MTIEEAAATLGLKPSDANPEQVERNYRLKAKHCHPDRAHYPGADAEFKRATEAFHRLRQPAEWPTQSDRPAASSEITSAADEFLFAAAYCYPEPWLHMSAGEWVGKLAGWYAFRFRASGVVKKGMPLAELCRRRDGVTLRSLLVAPIDAEVIEVDPVGFFHTWCLRPLETGKVGRRLQRSVAQGGELSIAVEQLQDELFTAARLPLNA